MDMNIETSKSFATEANLMKALTRLGFEKHHFIIVRNRAGRFTAIFPVSACSGYLGLFASKGFTTLG